MFEWRKSVHYWWSYIYFLQNAKSYNQHASPSIIQVGCPTCCYQVCALDHANVGTAGLDYSSGPCHRSDAFSVPPSKSALGYRNKTFPNYITQYHLPPHTHTQKILTKIYHFTMVSKLSTHNCSQFTAQYLKTIHWLGHEVGHPLYHPQSRSHNPKTRWLLKQLSGGPLLGARATCWVNHRGLNGFAH